MQDACFHAGLPTSLDLYSFRHLFRTSMLAFDVPEHLLTYMMGHETRGADSVNIFLERSLVDLVPIYHAAVERLIADYHIELNL